MTAERIDANNFVKQVSEETMSASFNLFKEAWCGSEEKPKNGQQHKGDSTNPFLAPLTKGISTVGEMYWKQVEEDLNEALKKPIF